MCFVLLFFKHNQSFLVTVCLILALVKGEAFCSVEYDRTTVECNKNV